MHVTGLRRVSLLEVKSTVLASGVSKRNLGRWSDGSHRKTQKNPNSLLGEAGKLRNRHIEH